MGEARRDALRVGFDGELKLAFHGARITSDAGLLAYCELDDALGLTEATDQLMHDDRTGLNRQHTLTGQLRQAISGRLAGYEDTNDAERLAVDPAMRHIVGGRARRKTAASTSQMSRFETRVLTRPEHLAALRDLSGRWINAVQSSRKPLREIVLDLTVRSP